MKTFGFEFSWSRYLIVAIIVLPLTGLENRTCCWKNIAAHTMIVVLLYTFKILLKLKTVITQFYSQKQVLSFIT